MLADHAVTTADGVHDVMASAFGTRKIIAVTKALPASWLQDMEQAIAALPP